MRLPQIALAIPFLSRPCLQLEEVLAKGFSNQCGAILLGVPRGAIGGLQELFVEYDLDGFHVWTLFHSIVHSEKSRLKGGCRLNSPPYKTGNGSGGIFDHCTDAEDRVLGSGSTARGRNAGQYTQSSSTAARKSYLSALSRIFPPVYFMSCGQRVFCCFLCLA